MHQENNPYGARVVTTAHDAKGTSIIASDVQTTPFEPFGPGSSSFNIFHTTDSVPASNNTPLPSSKTTSVPRAPPNGAMFCTTDIPVGGAAPMHRTLSLDYCCVLSGEITLVVDGGQEATIRAGEIVLQRGAMHLWKNNGTVSCRILVVMLGSEKVKTEDGQEFDEFFPKRPGA